MKSSPLLKPFEAYLEAAFPLPNTPYALVYEAARYALFAGGKRLRPLLLLQTAEALGAPLKKAYAPAGALEMIHTYSLIHDDLPAMDNDDFRRGKPTLHKIYPEGQALLAGDLLLTQAFECLAEAPDFSSDEKIEMIRILSQAAGGRGMIGGQALDLDGQALSQEALDLMHQMKTGALFEAAVELGAVTARAPQTVRQALKRFARYYGLAFQIQDDIRDVTHPKEKHGKALSSDAAKNKATYVSLMGLDASREALARIMELAEAELRSFPELLEGLTPPLPQQQRSS
jgi:geranylgeranyl pyrophosphate synthase